MLLAGVAFGLLHNNGGRNWAFAAWASLVGVAYGSAFLYTEVRMRAPAAHSWPRMAQTRYLLRHCCQALIARCAGPSTCQECMKILAASIRLSCLH